MDLGVKDKIVLVTGSSLGIGKGIAASFLEEGAVVVISGRHRDTLKRTENEFKKTYGPARVHSFAGDLGQEPTAEELASFIEKEFGFLDHLVCNIGSGRSVPPLEEDEAEWQRMLQINLLTSTTCVRVLLPLFEKRSGGSGSRTSITFVSSICGSEALGCPVAYSAAKSALRAYAKNIARPLGRRGIRVNVVSPGNIIFPDSTWEDKLAENRQAVEAMLDREVPLNRLGTLEEIADVVVFLASVRASFVTGAEWIVDGGQTRDL